MIFVILLITNNLVSEGQAGQRDYFVINICSSSSHGGFICLSILDGQVQPKFSINYIAQIYSKTQIIWLVLGLREVAYRLS